MKSCSEYDISSPSSIKSGVNVEMPLVHIIRDFVEENGRGAIYMDGLEYLKVVNGFDKLLKVITEITDMVILSDFILVVPADPKSFSERELSQLEISLEIMGLSPQVYSSKRGLSISKMGFSRPAPGF